MHRITVRQSTQRFGRRLVSGWVASVVEGRDLVYVTTIQETKDRALAEAERWVRQSGFEECWIEESPHA